MQTLYAAGVLVFRQGPPREFLLMAHPTRWDLPKGHREPGEALLACALRELYEETGIAPDQMRLDQTFRFQLTYPVTYDGQRYQKVLTIYLGWVQGPVTITPTEHQGYRWVRWGPPHRFDNPTLDPLLAQVAAYLGA
jgi:bis(5'-nucleosidyl)-tetraphosphatase